MGRSPVLSGKSCYHCGSKETSKAGMARGKQRYKCRGCGKTFREGPHIPSGDWDPRMRKYNLPTAGQLILELQKIAQSILGRTPTTDDINALSKTERSHSLATYYAVFGSYVTAVRRAKLKQHYLQQFDKADRTRMLNQLRALSCRLKRPLLGRDVMAARKKKLVSPINHYQLAFGTIPKAIAEAGVAPKIVYSKEEIIAVLRKIDANFDRPIKATDIDKLWREGRGPNHRQVQRKFGSLAKARKAAGTKTRYPGARPQYGKY